MSDMSHVYNAYAAVHNSEKRNNLNEVRDHISEMTLTQLTDIDLYEVAEEVLEEVFSNGTSVAEAQELIESVFKKASEGDVSPIRADKVERLGEAFVTAFEKVKERSLRTAVESYSEYRRNKERLEKWWTDNLTVEEREAVERDRKKKKRPRLHHDKRLFPYKTIQTA